MPIKWTPDIDQLLLLKILETHELKVDAKKISEAWPTDKGEAPTARAITERLVKIRSNAVKAGAAHFGISSAQSKSVSSTPSKPRATPAKKTATTPLKPNVKTATRLSAEEDTSERPAQNVVRTTEDASPTPKRKLDAIIKPEPGDVETIDLATPSRPAPAPTNHVLTASKQGRQPDLSAHHARAPLLAPGSAQMVHKLPVRHSTGGLEELGSPTKRARRASSRCVAYEEDDTGAQSDAEDDEYEDEEEVAV